MSPTEGGPSPEFSKRVKKELIDVYDSISADYDRTRRRVWPRTREFVEGLQARGRALDIGCGNGKDTILLLQNGFSTTSVDLSKEQCRITKENIRSKLSGGELVLGPEQTFEVVQADCEDLPFDDGLFDAAVFMATLHHLPDALSRHRALTEMRRCLKQGGRALVSVWALDQPRFEREYARQLDEGLTETLGDVWVPWKSQEGGTFSRYYHLFLAPDLENLVGGAGFGEADFFTEDGNHFARVRK